MKTSPGSPKTKDAILGRGRELEILKGRLEKESVLLTAERRVGKTSLINKLCENPPENTVIIKCTVESVDHPSELVGLLYSEAKEHKLFSRRKRLFCGVETLYAKLAETEISGWHLPQIRQSWKELLQSLVKDISDNGSHRVILVFDELPQMVSNVIRVPNPNLAMEFLDEIRALQHRHGDDLRFLLAGSIGLHLIVKDLKENHDYKGNPTNAMRKESLGGMHLEDVELLCCKFLDEEGIRRTNPVQFTAAINAATDGLPIYVEYICDRFQDSRPADVSAADIEQEVTALLDSPEVQWFSDAAKRIEDYYKRLNCSETAEEILKFLCNSSDLVQEKEILDHIKNLVDNATDSSTKKVLELLEEDHYLKRTVIGENDRRYSFLYSIMRRWWQRKRG